MWRKKTLMIIGLSLLILLVTGAGMYLHNLLNRRISSPLLVRATRAEKWRKDLLYVKNELPKRHKNLFFSKSQNEFNRELDSLLHRINGSSDLELQSGLAKIINSINDSHTMLDITGTLIYPLSFYEFDDGIYVNNVAEEYRELWGKRLIAINGYSIPQLRDKLDPYISHDNQAITRNQFCSYLRLAAILKMAGIVPNEKATFNFAGVPNLTLELTPIELVDRKTKFLSELPEFLPGFPLCRQKPDQNYWYEYLDTRKAIYVKYNSCANMPDYSFAAFTKDVFAKLDQEKAQVLIVDLRDNGGGNSMIFSPFLRAIQKRPRLNQKENLFVIIGRKTFSSAVLNAMDLRKKTQATLIGESTGGKPNHFGEVKVLHLSNVNLDLYYSSQYFRTMKTDPDSVIPDVNLSLTAASLFNGQDDFLNYVLGRNEVE